MVARIQELASGLNEKRTGLKQLLHLIDHQEIDPILIVSCPSAMAISKRLFVGKQVRIEVVEPPEVQTPPEELVADVLSMARFFQAGCMEARRKKFARVCHLHSRTV